MPQSRKPNGQYAKQLGMHISTKRSICVNADCGNLVRNKGRNVHGNIRYGIECHKCHRKAETSPKYALENSECSLCGWDKAPCDRHRKDPYKGYVEGNVVPLCPNCHRLVTFGKISLEDGV
jgi:hypothetical protein